MSCINFIFIFNFSGKTNIQNAGVEYIIDSVIQALKRNPARK